jgi:hypothetical protein
MAANAATVDKSLVNTCKLYDSSGVFTTASIVLGLRIQATIPDSIAKGGTANITNAKATATITGPGVNVARAFGDKFTGEATAFQLGLTGATPATLNAAATPIPIPAQVLPVPVNGVTPDLKFDVPATGVLAPIGPLTATGAVGTSVVASFPAIAQALVTSINFEKNSAPGVLVPYQLRCKPNAFIDDDETIPQDLTLGSVPIVDGPVAAPPTVTGLAPTHGALAGGTSVTISGTNLGNVSGVTVGGKAATLGAKAAGSVVITTPAGTAAGSAPVVVTNPDGTATSSFTYDPKPTLPPTVTGLNPNHGALAGGTSVTISGTNLDTTSGVTVGGIG